MIEDQDRPEAYKTSGECADTAAAERRVDAAVRRTACLIGRQKQATDVVGIVMSTLPVVQKTGTSAENLRPLS